MESKDPLPTPSLSEPAEVLLAKLLDPDGPARVPRLFSGSRALRLSDILDRAIGIVLHQQPLTRFVVFSPSHPEGVLAGLAEGIEALYPDLTQRRLRQTPATGWSGAIQRAMTSEDPPVRRVMVIEPLDELWDPQVSEHERTQFIHHLTTIANFRATRVLFVMDSSNLDHCQRSRLLQPCLTSRFHLRLAGAAPAPRITPPPIPSSDILPLQPIRPRQTRPNLRDHRAFDPAHPATSPA